jgi:hypothetical protein
MKKKTEALELKRICETAFSTVSGTTASFQPLPCSKPPLAQVNDPPGGQRGKRQARPGLGKVLSAHSGHDRPKEIFLANTGEGLTAWIKRAGKRSFRNSRVQTKNPNSRLRPLSNFVNGKIKGR